MRSFVHRQEELLISDGKNQVFSAEEEEKEEDLFIDFDQVRSELKLSWLIGGIDLSVDCRIVGGGAELEWSRFSLLKERHPNLTSAKRRMASAYRRETLIVIDAEVRLDQMEGFLVDLDVLVTLQIFDLVQT